ncbi:hypothetical protein RCO48_32045 [Peribacillus frigoritolerans]|nr:hypothetical protein [Peribacillus frigoritolerans]
MHTYILGHIGRRIIVQILLHNGIVGSIEEDTVQKRNKGFYETAKPRRATTIKGAGTKKIKSL